MRTAPIKTISQLRLECRNGGFPALLHCQIDELTKKESAAGKPFWELRLRDSGDSLVLRAWAETPAYEDCEARGRGNAIEIEGEFLINGSFGLDSKRWRLRDLDAEERVALLAGSAEAAANAERDFADVTNMVAAMADPRLLALCQLFLQDHGERFKRSAAARNNHHAHRGGLLRHTAQMMRVCVGFCDAYPILNRDLLVAGTLFHDSGKLWEVCPPESGFDIPRELRGELLGHISIGIELVNSLWRKLPLDEWKSLRPNSEETRLHLLHLIASHHGELEFGSPVQPRTPEAAALHFADNLDARIEMFSSAYVRQPEVAPGIFERVRPINVYPVKPLATFVPVVE